MIDSKSRWFKISGKKAQRKMLRFARKTLRRADQMETLCIDDFLDGMGDRDPKEEENCLKAKKFLSFLIEGLDERLADIAKEKGHRLNGS
jgi:hypothetical protein